MPKSTNPQYIDWTNSEARIVLMEDLVSGTLPLDHREVSPAEAFAYYKEQPAFKGLVCYEQFKSNLSRHRRDLLKNKSKSKEGELAIIHDRELYPSTTHNSNGDLNYKQSKTKELLRVDMAEQKHLSMTPKELKATRPEYDEFDLHKFTEKIGQEKRYQKYIYYLNDKREEKLQKAAAEKQAAVDNRDKIRAEKEIAVANAAASANGKRRRVH